MGNAGSRRSSSRAFNSRYGGPDTTPLHTNQAAGRGLPSPDFRKDTANDVLWEDLPFVDRHVLPSGCFLKSVLVLSPTVLEWKYAAVAERMIKHGAQEIQPHTPLGNIQP